MTPADHYRKLAAQLRAMAREADSPHLVGEWQHLADCYILLAQQAEKNAGVDTVYEPGPPRLTGGPATEPQT